MGLVECVGCKISHFVEYLVSNSAVNTVFAAPVNKIASLLLHNIVLFFAHGTTHNISPAVRISCQGTEYLHNLLLIHHTAVGVPEYGLQHRGVITDVALVVRIGNEGIYLTGRTGTVQ